MIRSYCLGQVGYIFEVDKLKICIDPYLSNNVENKYSLTRIFKYQKFDKVINNLDYVFITHEHEDHCDISTLLKIYKSSPNVIFICPSIVSRILTKNRIPQKNIYIPTENKKNKINQETYFIAVPSAHPEIERDQNGNSLYFGYIFYINKKLLYHAGDTSLTKNYLKIICKYKNFDTIFLPVNESNYVRLANNIIGNMSIREAFYLAEILKTKNLVPTHWDMFLENSTCKNEIKIIYKKNKYSFKLKFYPKYL